MTSTYLQMASFQDGFGRKFEASSLAKWFHSAPHKDFKLDDTSTIFSPSDQSYREALYLIAIFISSFGGFLFLLIVVYYTCCYCICCCKTTERRQDESYHSRKSCLQISVFILALIVCGAFIAGFIYNGKASDGVDDFRNSVEDIQDNINYAATMGKKMETALQQIQYKISELEDRSHLPDAAKAYVLSLKMINNLSAVNNLLPQHVVNESSDAADKVHRYDNYRWLATVILLSWCIFLCIFIFWVGCQVNGCVLAMASVFCLLTILFTWAITGADFAIATGIGDFCVNPKEAVEKIKKGHSTSIPGLRISWRSVYHILYIFIVVISYYMSCDGSQDDPFSQNLSELHSCLDEVIDLIQNIPIEYEDLTKTILNELYRVNDDLSIYEEHFACQRIHKEYIDAMDALCGKTLNSVGIVILTVFLIAFLSGLLTCFICPLWRYRRPRPTTYNDIQSPPDDIGNSVMWRPHDIDAESDHSFHRRHGNPTERSPLIVDNHHPNYESGNQPNMNFIHVDVHHSTVGRGDRQSENRHSF